MRYLFIGIKSDDMRNQNARTREQSNETRPVHYQTGRGTLCSLDNDANIRTHTEDKSTVTCRYCVNLLENQ